MIPAESPQARSGGWTQWRCSTEKENGSACNNVLVEWTASPGVKLRLRKRCEKCKVWHELRAVPVIQ